MTSKKRADVIAAAFVKISESGWNPNVVERVCSKNKINESFIRKIAGYEVKKEKHKAGIVDNPLAISSYKKNEKLRNITLN